MRPEEFDPLAYIENAFLDKSKREVMPDSDELSVAIPSISDYLTKKGELNGQNTRDASSSTAIVERVDNTRIIPSPQALIDDLEIGGSRRTRFKKTLMSAPRPRRTKSQATKGVIDPELQSTWETLPKSIDFLCSFYDDSVTANYYGGNFKETRNALIQRLLDPELSLEETSRLLGVCPATVRRYTNRSWLTHHRTTGGQRRFRLSDIVKFVEAHGRFPEE
jgi:excisionase family DNA binding protein